MQKKNSGMLQSLSQLERWNKIKANVFSKAGQSRLAQAIVAKKWSFLLIGMAFLLGRATILEELSPFALSFFAVMYFQRQELIPWIGVALFSGSLLSPYMQTGLIATQLIAFVLFQKAMEKYERSDISSAPLIVFASSFLVKLFSLLIVMDLTWYHLLMTAVEAVLCMVLTVIFIQALPIITLSRKNYQLKNEEIVCLIILLASVMTGTIGWQEGPLSMEHVLSRYLILLFACVGGAPFGASVGVISGLILSLADMNALFQMSLLAFSGMLAGMLKEGRRIGVAIGMLIGSSILSIYMGDQVEVMNSTWESLAAAALFLLTPKGILQTLAKYVPGTQEHLKSQQDYARRIRDATANRVEQFSQVFLQLARSFRQLTSDNLSLQKEDDVGHFMNDVAARSCANCHRRTKCWEESFYQTYRYMTDMMTELEVNDSFQNKDIPFAWRKFCVKPEAVLGIMKEQYGLYRNNLHWRRQISDSRQLVAEQLTGVSQVMEDLAKEIKREGQELFLQEEQIRTALEELGLSIHSIDIVCLDEGKVEIEMIHHYEKGYDECRKIIAPLLSEILGENIAVLREERLPYWEGYSSVMFGSANEYSVETGFASVMPAEAGWSGDSYSASALGNGKYAVALSDGMGNGERARAESQAALGILQQLLQSGMDERLAVKSVNSVLLLRSPEEMYATVDMALIDLFHAQTTFLKIGSTPSFIKRGSEVIPITASNLPVGIIKDIDVDLVTMQLKDDDYLIMMTDGIYDAPGHAVNKELWMKRMIGEIVADTPQEFADCLLERVIRSSHGTIHDDMTVVVARIVKRMPEWATFRWPKYEPIERSKTVS